MKTILAIQWVHCDSCVKLITMELEDIEGVETMSITHANNMWEAVIEHDESVSKDMLKDAIAEAGEYEVE